MFGIVLYPTLLVGLFFGPAFLILDFGVESGFMFGGALAFVALNMVWTKYDRESRDKADKDMTPYPIGGGQTVPMRQWYMHFPECFWRDFHYDFYQAILIKIPGAAYVIGMALIGLSRWLGV